MTRPAAAQRLRPRPTCGEITGHHSLANASENSCITPSVIGATSPGRPFSLPCQDWACSQPSPTLPNLGRAATEPGQLSLTAPPPAAGNAADDGTGEGI